MAKIVHQSHITGERGVNAFADYCNNHVPYLIWRPTTVNDFGIDGEIELTHKNQDGKIEASGRIIKVQVKSTSTGSYIYSEDDYNLTFQPNKDDLDYWNKYDLDVILVLYDDRQKDLYAVKIDESHKIGVTKKYPIIFNKQKNKLVIGENNFDKIFGNSLKKRIDYNFHEIIYTNVLKFSKLPKLIYKYQSQFKSKKKIFEIVTNEESPEFVLNNGTIYTFLNLKSYATFYNKIIIPESDDFDTFKEFIKEKNQWRLVSELINIHFSIFLRKKKIYFSKEYKRYYWGKNKEYSNRVETYDSRKRKDQSRNVVIYKKYIVTEFYRHLAFQTSFFSLSNEIYFVITPKYLFTSDGKTPLSNVKKITSLTNYVKFNEHNPQILNHIYFIGQFLKSKSDKIVLCNFDNAKIELTLPITLKSDFGIYLDNSSLEIDSDTEINDEQLKLLIE